MNILQRTIQNIIQNIPRVNDISGVLHTIILQDSNNGNVFIFFGENHNRIDREALFAFITDEIMQPMDQDRRMTYEIISECSMKEYPESKDCYDIRMDVAATPYFDDRDIDINDSRNVHDFKSVVFGSRLDLQALTRWNRYVTTNNVLMSESQVQILEFLLQSLDEEYLAFILNGYKTSVPLMSETLIHSNGRFVPFIKLLVQTLTYIFLNDRQPLKYVIEFGVLLNDFFIQLHLFRSNKHVNVVWYGYVHIRKTVKLMLRSGMYHTIYEHIDRRYF